MDPIERQAAIEALRDEFKRIPTIAIRAMEVIKALSSIRCKDCKHNPSGSGANHDISFPDEVCPCQCEDYWYSWMPKDDWFCGSWERREDE